MPCYYSLQLNVLKKIVDGAHIPNLFRIFAANFRTMEKTLLGTSVGKLRNRLHRLMKERYAAEAEKKITIEEFMILTMIHSRKNLILQNIAEDTGKDKSVIVRTLDSLQRKGLCKRTPNPVDRRENFLSVTPTGKAVVTQYQDIERKLSQELVANIPADKLDTFFEVVELIYKNSKEM